MQQGWEPDGGLRWGSSAASWDAPWIRGCIVDVDVGDVRMFGAGEDDCIWMHEVWSMLF